MQYERLPDVGKTVFRLPREMDIWSESLQCLCVVHEKLAEHELLCECFDGQYTFVEMYIHEEKIAVVAHCALSQPKLDLIDQLRSLAVFLDTPKEGMTTIDLKLR